MRGSWPRYHGFQTKTIEAQRPLHLPRDRTMRSASSLLSADRHSCAASDGAISGCSHTTFGPLTPSRSRSDHRTEAGHEYVVEAAVEKPSGGGLSRHHSAGDHQDGDRPFEDPQPKGDKADAGENVGHSQRKARGDRAGTVGSHSDERDAEQQYRERHCAAIEEGDRPQRPRGQQPRESRTKIAALPVPATQRLDRFHNAEPE